MALRLRKRLHLTIDREAWRRKAWVPVTWLIVAAVWMAQALDALVTEHSTGLHVLAATTLVLALPFAAFWTAVLWRKHRHRR